MIVEKIIFTIVATYLLIAMIFKLIKKFDKIHISIILLQSLGFILGLIELISNSNFNIFIKTLMYLISIIIPIAVIILENKGKDLMEIFYMLLAKFYEITRKQQKM